MTLLWYVFSVAVVVLVPRVCAEESVHDRGKAAGEAAGEAAEGHPMEELMSKLSHGKAAEESGMEELMSKLSQAKAAEEPLVEELLSKLSLSKAAGGNSMEEFVKKFTNLLKKAAEGDSVEDLKKKNSRTKDLEVLKKLLQMMALIMAASKRSQQGKAAEGHPMEELMSKLPQMRSEQGHATEEIMEKLPQGETAEDIAKLLEEGSQAEERDYIKDTVGKLADRNYVFNSNYIKVKTAAKGWKNHCPREIVVPLMYKVGLMSYLFMTNRTITGSKLGRRIYSIEDNIDLFDPCEHMNLNKAGLDTCWPTKFLLHAAGVAATTAGHLSEAYVRTILFSDSDKFKLLNNEMFSVFTEFVSTNLVMLKYVFKMAVIFKNVVSARYLNGPFPISGTERDFVKASDQLYAAVADFVLISKITLGYTQIALLRERKSELDVVMPVFVDSYEYVVRRGIPEEYNGSPYPPVSYYWDMAALQHALSLLSDIEGLAERTLQEQEESTENLILDKKSLSNAVTIVHGLLTLTSAKLKSDELQAALKSATNGLRLAVSSLEEAGLELEKYEGSETLPEHLVSLLKTIFPPRPVFPPLPLESMPSIPAKVPSLRMLASIIPSNYNQLMKMVTKVAAVLAGARGSLVPRKAMLVPLSTEELGLSGNADFEEPGRISKSINIARSITAMMAALRSEKAKYVLVDVLQGGDSELLRQVEDGDKCLLSNECKQGLLGAMIETSLIINDPGLHQQWESTRSSPFKGKSLDELLVDAGLPFRVVRNPSPPFGASPNAGLPFGALMNAGIAFWTLPSTDSPFNTKEEKNEQTD